MSSCSSSRTLRRPEQYLFLPYPICSELAAPAKLCNVPTCTATNPVETVDLRTPRSYRAPVRTIHKPQNSGPVTHTITPDGHCNDITSLTSPHQDSSSTTAYSVPSVRGPDHRKASIKAARTLCGQRRSVSHCMHVVRSRREVEAVGACIGRRSSGRYPCSLSCFRFNPAIPLDIAGTLSTRS